MKRVLTSIWFLALIVSVPLIVSLPSLFDKYQVELLSKKRKINLSNNIHFKDLDSDGKAERIETYESHSNLLSFQCFNEQDRLIDQYNFPHFYDVHLNALSFSDMDEDSLLEVYGCTFQDDSIFLSWVEPLDTLPRFHTRFITTIDTERRTLLDARLGQMCFFDFDKDGNKEIVFSLEVGYNWFPRKMFVYHPEVDSLHSSNNYGSHFSNLIPFGNQSDGTTELLCVSSSAGNIPSNIDINYRDNRPRLFVFNSDLELAFDPIEFPVGLGSRIYPYFTDKKKKELITLYHNFSSENTMTFMVKMNLDGSMLNEDTLFLPSISNKPLKVGRGDNNEIFIYERLGKLYKVSEDLRIKDSIDLGFTADHMLVESLDLYKDNVREYCIIDEHSKQLQIYLDNFQETIMLDFDEMLAPPYVVLSPIKNQFLVLGTRFYYTYQISRNPYYFLKIPFYILIYMAVVGFIWVLQLARMKQLQEKMELQNQVRELQLRTLKNQLDPHFIFNTFNTIASVVKQGRNDEAYNIMVRFSKMVRINLESSGKIYTTLQGEMDFIKDYLAIQKFRFKDLFDYSIEIPGKIRLDIPIPKLLVQIHVENALKHGIRPAKKGGKIIVRVKQEASVYIIEIEDNGIGREESKRQNTGGTGIGLKTIKQILDLNNQNRKNRINQEIHDLIDEKGKAKGTLIVLRITAGGH